MAIINRRRHRDPDDVQVIELSESEWDSAVRRSLKDLRLTMEELAEQARTGNFSSLRARKLWLTIGHRHRDE
jgi:hypothetical protein